MAKVHHAVEMAKTVVEVADLAWLAVDHLHSHKHHHQDVAGAADRSPCLPPEDVDSLKSENEQLRRLLERNLELLKKLHDSPAIAGDCPADLRDRLQAVVDSKDFQARIQSLQYASMNGSANDFPFKERTGGEFDAAEVHVSADKEEPSCWVWVTDEMVPGTVEERSRVDDEGYVVVWEDQVVDGVANFIAKCIVSNPKSQKLTSEELQKAVTKSLAGVNKFEMLLSIWNAGAMFYALSTWGLALAGCVKLAYRILPGLLLASLEPGLSSTTTCISPEIGLWLYSSRSAIKLAAKGVHRTGKLVMRAL